MRTAFPGNVVVNKTGGASNNIVTMDVSSTINGNLNCTEGVINVLNGITLKVLGNLTVEAGCELDIDPGGTLKLGNGSVLTVDSGGTLIGTNTYAGNPETITFSLGAGVLTVDADVTTPPMRCVYVEYDIATGATNGNTVGVQIASGSDMVNDQSYALSSGTPAPITLGTASTISAPTTIWTGTTSTTWTDSGNWSAGVPTTTRTCQIPNVANDPVISGAEVCGSVDITTGILTINGGGFDLL